MFELTKHAFDVLKERNIPEEYISRVLENPGLRMDDRDDPELEHYLAMIVEKGDRILRVIVTKNSSPLRIVTAFFDRSMRGKL